jgi:hypothetical protein
VSASPRERIDEGGVASAVEQIPSAMIVSSSDRRKAMGIRVLYDANSGLTNGEPLWNFFLRSVATFFCVPFAL